MTAANANNPDAIMILFAAQGCSRAMQAEQLLGVKAMMVYPGSCADKSVLAAGGAGADGAVFNSKTVSSTTRRARRSCSTARRWRSTPERDCPSTPTDPQDTFAAMMNLDELFNKIGYTKLNPEEPGGIVKGSPPRPNHQQSL